MARMTTARTSGGWAAWSASARSSMRWMLSALTGGLSSVIQATWLATSHRTSAFSSSATTKSFSLASTRRDTASGTGPLWVVDCDPAQVKRQRRSPANPPETRGRAAPRLKWRRLPERLRPDPFGHLRTEPFPGSVGHNNARSDHVTSKLWVAVAVSVPRWQLTVAVDVPGLVLVPTFHVHETPPEDPATG